MAFISLIEIIHIAIVILGVGYIFTGLLPLRITKNVLDSYTKKFNWKEFWFACLVASPGIILHEMAHKFVALGLGLQALFQVSYFGLALGIILKILNTGFIILAPGYVLISGATTLESILTAAAGPLTNLILWVAGFLIIKHSKKLSRKQAIFWSLTAEINKWLFIFNILPIPPLDGSKIWIPLFQMIF
ncbi:hypothetical protein J4216_00885 [Candidatus Woesearchaeota archaeon]|nr:hypothetical protein [Candidatus Woesearchaeota archaeon]